MFYYLFTYLDKLMFPEQVCSIISHSRSAMAVITSLFISLLIGRVIRFLQVQQMGEVVRI